MLKVQLKPIYFIPLLPPNPLLSHSRWKEWRVIHSTLYFHHEMVAIRTSHCQCSCFTGSFADFSYIYGSIKMEFQLLNSINEIKQEGQVCTTFWHKFVWNATLSIGLLGHQSRRSDFFPGFRVSHGLAVWWLVRVILSTLIVFANCRFVISRWSLRGMHLKLRFLMGEKNLINVCYFEKREKRLPKSRLPSSLHCKKKMKTLMIRQVIFFVYGRY